MNKPSEHSICSPESLTLFHYGELDAAERLQMENHLQDCADCRRELAQLRSALEMLPTRQQEIPREEIQAFNERVSRRLRPKPHRPLNPALGWSLAAAAAVLVMVTLYSPTPGPQQPPPEVSLQTGGDTGRLPEAELLLNMELLENLDLLQELEGTGASG